MQEFLLYNYEWVRALHIIAVISWMAGMLYLPRLFIYHVDAKKGSKQSETFKVMERKLLKIIINPAMIASFLFGGAMIMANPEIMSQPWIHVKLTAAFILAGMHGMLVGDVRRFAADENTKAAKYFRIINEVPAVLMIIIVIMAVVEPF